MRRKKLMYVDPDFHSLLKTEAAKRGQTILDFTKDMVGKDNEMFRSSNYIKLKENEPEKKKFSLFR